MNFTPGPWVASLVDGGIWRIETANGQRIATVAAKGYGVAESDNPALVSAAPDMLASLEECEPFIVGPGTAGILMRLRAALAKARGAELSEGPY